MSKSRSSIVDAIIAAAESIVRERGADALGMNEVAQRAGVSRATLYRAIGGRAALLEALSARAPLALPKDSRAKVLFGAKHVFVRHGFDGATIEQIANRAGVSEATVYRLFGDKEGIVSAFFEEFAPRRAARSIRERPSGDLRQDLRRFAEHSLAIACESPEFVRVTLVDALKQGSIVARVRRHTPERTIDSLIALFEAHRGELRGASPSEAAQAFAGMIMGVGVFGPALHGVAVPDAKDMAEKITALFCDGALESPRRTHEIKRPSRSKPR